MFVYKYIYKNIAKNFRIAKYDLKGLNYLDIISNYIIIMFSDNYDTDDNIQALATAPGESALAIIRLSGPEVLAITASVFSNPQWCKEAEGSTMKLGYILDDKRRIDQVMLAVFRAPASYTGQDMAEIFCHGNMAGITEIQKTLRKAGFRDALPGEFTFRAFMNKKIDLTQAEAVQEIIQSKSGKAHHLALDRLSGGIRSLVKKLRIDLFDIVSNVELQLDYPEDEIEDSVELPINKIETACVSIKELLATYRSGKLFQDGVKVVLTGRTNSGKSSLFNLFLKEDRAIVSDIHGTTRDYLESWIIIDGLPVILIDTAGLRDADNPIEAEGIRRSQEKVEEGHIIIYVIDGVEGQTEEDSKCLTDIDDNDVIIKVWNKCDLPEADIPKGELRISALTAEGFSDLETAVKSAAVGQDLTENEVVLDSERQKVLFEECLEHLEHSLKGAEKNMSLDVLALDLRCALDTLGQISGEVSSADVLEHMFTSFCVGK